MADSGKVLGTIDGGRVYYECHPGAIYLHAGRSYLIRELDRDRRRVTAEPASVDYYTVVMGDKETEILERLDTRTLGPHPIGLGRLKVTVRIREYQKKRLFDGETLATHPLEVPPLVFETVGLWIELPSNLPAKFTERELHFMGGIHATEHAAIGLFPLLAIADRGDVGGISYTGHPQIGGPAIFVYDGVPGGAGLAEQGYRSLESHLGRTLELVGSCPCDDGCPSCIQSPRCGNGNKPLDKSAALEVLGLLTGGIALESYGVAAAEPSWNRPLTPFPTSDGGTEAPTSRHGIRRAGNLEPTTTAPQPTVDAHNGRRLFFDLETQRGAEEVGGWGNTARMGLAVAIVFDAERQSYRTYYEADVEQLLLDLVTAERVVGFNIDRFDLQVLSGYTDWDLGRIRTLDMLGELHRRLGFRISLEHLSETNLGEGKAGSGLQSLRWWKEGRLDLIEQYCRKDVEVTRRLFELGREQGYLLYRDHEERKVRVPVQW
jgi:DEAD/DEAH box helicase domain-containing protein